MADKGDVLSVFEQVAAGAYATFKPTPGNEAVLHNVTCEAEITLRWSDGVNTLPIFNHTPDEFALTYYDFHCTDAVWIECVNEDAATKGIRMDGIVTK